MALCISVVSVAVGQTLWVGRNGRLAGLGEKGEVSWLLFPRKTPDNLVTGKTGEVPPPGIVLGVRVGEKISWMDQGQETLSYAQPGQSVLVWEWKDETSALSATVQTCWDDEGVLLQNVFLKNQGEETLKNLSLLAHARLRPKGEDAVVRVQDQNVFFPLHAGCVLTLAGSRDLGAVLVGSKDAGSASEALTAWSQGADPVAVESVTGTNLHFCAVWEMNDMKKDEEAEASIRWALAADEEGALRALSGSLQRTPEQILASNPVLEARHKGDGTAQALGLIHALCQDSGAILSAYPPSLGVRVWDGSLACVALSAMGFHDQALGWLEFLAEIDPGFGGWWSSYQASGEQVFLPLPSVDATAMALFAFLVEGRRDTTLLQKHWGRIEEAADFLGWWQSPSGIPAPAWDRQAGDLISGSWSLTHAYTGLASASEMASLLGDQDKAVFYARQAARLKESMEETFIQDGTLLARFVGWTGLGAQVLEGWGPVSDTWSLLWNLHRVVTGKDLSASLAGLGWSVWPAGIKETMEEGTAEGNNGLDDLVLAMAMAFRGSDSSSCPNLSLFEEKSQPFVQSKLLGDLPSLSSAAALCLSSLGQEMPAPPTLLEGTQPFEDGVDFVSRLKQVCEKQDVSLTVTQDRVEMVFQLGELLRDLPTALRKAPAPSMQGAKAIPKEADGVLALSVSDEQADRMPFAEWLSESIASAGEGMKDRKTEIKMAVNLLFQFVYPSLEVGFFGLTEEGGAQWLVSMQLRPEKAALFSTWIQTPLKNFGLKYEKTETEHGMVLSFEGNVSLIVTGENLLVTGAGASMAQRALDAVSDPNQSVISKIPDTSDLGPLVLYVDSEKLAERASKMEEFLRHAPGSSRLRSILISPVPSDQNAALVIRCLLDSAQ